MNDRQDVTLGEVGRAVHRIEEKLDAALDVQTQHALDIALLKQNRSAAIWVLNGVWALLLLGVEWLLHGSKH